MSTTTARPRTRIYTIADVAKHNSPSSLWVMKDGFVYDLTHFAPDHPGGNDLIHHFAGQDLGEAMSDPEEHLHSDSAFELLSQYVIGKIGKEANIVKEDVVIGDDWEPEETDLKADFKRNEFLDLEKPLLRQVWEANFSKDFYLQQVHQPRHLPYSARLFGPWYLEMLTRTAWYVVPIFWLPIVAYLAYRSVMGQKVEGWRSTEVASTWTGGLMLSGIFIWTIIEYGMHRFLFHVDDYLPDHRIAITAHFLLHGIHHNLPMDRLRLVMPPILFGTLQYPFTQLAYKLFPVWMANGIIAGSFFAYCGYDCGHYAMHHTKLPKYLKQMKVYHMEHHFRNYEAGFGVTSPLWDIVFNTGFAARPVAVKTVS